MIPTPNDTKSDETLELLVARGGLSPDESTERDIAMAAVRRGLFGDDAAPPKIGRFVVLHKLAAGGMGIVYVARDDELDRKVALKVIRDHARVSAERLQREAQILAKLSHPNVVPVYEVGTHDGQLFIAMELVEGMTLRRWCDEAPRSPQEIIAVYTQAGEGLAAAHAAGLVHRDFKPDNALIGDDGRVRVVDFGVARRDGVPLEDARAHSPAPVEPDARLTVTGAMLGTPAYMAPEQFLARPVDARSDQFAFCVSLWEALHRQHPFGGGSVHSLADAVVAGDLRAPPPDAKVPRWLRDVLARGMQPEPDARYRSMKALLAALADDPRRRRRIAVAIAVVGAAGLSAAGARVWTDHRDRERTEQLALACESGASTMDEVWSDEPRARLHDALVASGASYAPTTAARVTEWLDLHADEWRRARQAACMDFDVLRIADAADHERTVQCLDARKDELAALVDELSRGDARSVQRAVQAAARLERVASCGDAELLARQPAPPPESRDAVRDVRTTLARASAMRMTGNFEEGLARARAALADAGAIGWSPLLGAAGLTTGTLLESQGAYAEAETTLATAYFAAFEGGAFDLAIDAANQLTFVVGNRLARKDDGLLWSRLADALLQPESDPTELRTADHLEKTALLHDVAGEHPRAIELLEAASEIVERRLGASHPEVVAKLSNLAIVYLHGGDPGRARTQLQRARTLAETTFGPEHPNVGTIVHNLGNVSLTLGEPAEARTQYLRALEIRAGALGEDHPDVGGTLNNLGQACFALGDLDEAEAHYRRALAIAEHVYGPDHPEVAGTVANLGDVDLARGDRAGALRSYERALAIAERTFGPEHPRVLALVEKIAHAKAGNDAPTDDSAAR